MDPNALVPQSQPAPMGIGQGILQMFASPMTQGIAQGLLAASGPSPTPQGWGPAIASGMQAGQQLQQVQAKQSLADALLGQKVQSMLMKSPLIQAQTALANQRALGNVGVAGAAGQIAAANRLAAMGQTDQANAILAQVAAQTGSLQANANYRNANVQYKNLPNTTKEALISQTGVPNTFGTTISNSNQVSTSPAGVLAPQAPSPANVPSQGTAPVAAVDTTSDAPSTDTAENTAADAEDVDGAPSAPVSSNSIALNQAALQGNAGLAALKSSVPGSVLQKNLYATNIEKTFAQMNPAVISSFSGVEGQAQLKSELAKVAADPNYTPPSNVQQYMNFAKVQAPILTNQINQFYGGSVQPSSVHDLLNQVTPDKWIANPQTALASFQSLQNLMGSEIQTYRGAIQGPAVYSGQGPAAQVAPALQAGAPSKTWTYNPKTGKLE